MILCISDLHIGYSDKALALLEYFCQTLLPDAERVYIIGDLFHLWIANPQLNINQDMNRACDMLSRAVAKHNTRLYLQRGNRDILLTKNIERVVPVTLLPDEYLLEACGKQYILLHGDQLCTLDRIFQRSRVLVQVLHRKLGFRYLPYSWIEHLVQKSQKTAKQASQHKPVAHMDVTEEAVMRAMTQHKTHLMIHGHTHKPHHHQWTIDEIDYHRWVLGSWDDGEAVYATIDETGVSLKTIRL